MSKNYKMQFFLLNYSKMYVIIKKDIKKNIYDKKSKNIFLGKMLLL